MFSGNLNLYLRPRISTSYVTLTLNLYYGIVRSLTSNVF